MTNPERVKQIIRSQDLDTLVASSSDGARKLDMVTGTAHDLEAAVDLMEQSFPGPYKLEGYRSGPATSRGRKTDADRPFVWIMAGIQARPQNGAASAPPPAPVVKEVPVPDKEAIQTAAEARADARIAEAEVMRLEAELAAMRGQLAALESELEDMEEEDDDAQAMAAPRPWWENGEEVDRKLDKIQGLLGKMSGKDAPPVLPAAGMTEEERELLHLARRWRATAPEQYQELTGQLKQAFGNDTEQQQPRSDGE